VKCPLLGIVDHERFGSDSKEMPDCLKDQCAWWVAASQSCAIEAIPRIIGYLGSELKTIKEAMPDKVKL